MDLQHKFILHILYWFGKDIELEVFRVCGRSPSRLLFYFPSGTHGLIKELGRHTNKIGLQDCPVGVISKESVEHFYFNALHMILKD